ncbi:MAG: hypothetical protein FWF75_00190 [Propionibacteriaceae bacterium]|nr:hypothetical protein [Propionibacteriaceae bacterium]
MNTSALRFVIAPIAVAGLLVSAAGCSMFGSPRDPAGQITASANLALSDLRAGDCIKDVNSFGTTAVTKVPVVPCTTSHNGEVFATTTDGATSDQSFAEDFCKQQFAGYIGSSFDTSKLDVEYFQPPSASSSDKTLTCIVYHKDGTMDTKSLKGSKQ